jgi:hypothetical protein
MRFTSPKSQHRKDLNANWQVATAAKTNHRDSGFVLWHVAEVDEPIGHDRLYEAVDVKLVLLVSA